MGFFERGLVLRQFVLRRGMLLRQVPRATSACVLGSHVHTRLLQGCLSARATSSGAPPARAFLSSVCAASKIGPRLRQLRSNVGHVQGRICCPRCTACPSVAITFATNVGNSARATVGINGLNFSVAGNRLADVLARDADDRHRRRTRRSAKTATPRAPALRQVRQNDIFGPFVFSHYRQRLQRKPRLRKCKIVTDPLPILPSEEPLCRKPYTSQDAKLASGCQISLRDRF